MLFFFKIGKYVVLKTLRFIYFAFLAPNYHVFFKQGISIPVPYSNKATS